MRTLNILFASVLFCTAMMGFTTPTFAIPLPGTYDLSSSVLIGSFTSDGDELTDWDFTNASLTSPFTPTRPNTIVEFNGVALFSHVTDNPPQNHPAISISWNRQALDQIIIRFDDSDNNIFIDRSGTATRTTIPGPSTMPLVAAGLLGFAGYRWYQRRHEGTQVG